MLQKDILGNIFNPKTLSEQEDDNYEYLDAPKSRFDTARWNSLTDTDRRPDPQLRDAEQAQDEEDQAEREERDSDYYDDIDN